jgi:hypothetical protein
MSRLLSITLAASALVACGGSPSQPSEAVPAPRAILGQAVDAIDGSPVGGVAVHVDSLWPVTADGSGMFSVEVGSAGTHRIKISAGSIVDRDTAIVGPAAERIRLTLIPTSFDLAAFDEMFRTANSRLQRWTTAPALVVVASVMAYHAGGSAEYEATAEQLSEEEAEQMVAHLREGLEVLTGGTFSSFASVSIERPAAGTRVAVQRGGRVVVGRYTGIVTMVNTIGYGQWSELPDGTVVGGAVFLDRDFDRDDQRRRLLRIHELGHALGYLHVKTRTSIMNPAIGPEPTEFDRVAARIAFQRPPGNRAPDADPVSSAGGFVVAGDRGGTWMPPVVCK